MFSRKPTLALLMTLAVVASASNVFAFTGGLTYFLRVFNDNFRCEPAACEKSLTTTVEIQSADSSPPAESPGISPARFEVPPGGVLKDFSPGRIEYPVAFNDSAQYLTTMLIHVADSKLGATDCKFEFVINVFYSAAGSTAKITGASANGIDYTNFEPTVSKRRCQVYPFAGQGPTLEIRSQSGFLKKPPPPSRLDPR